MRRLTLAFLVVVVLMGAGVAAAQQPAAPPASAPAAEAAKAAEAPKIDKGDTAWVLTSSLLVLMMTAPGLALFYAGMVRQKNSLATLMHCFIIAALISVRSRPKLSRAKSTCPCNVGFRPATGPRSRPENV